MKRGLYFWCELIETSKRGARKLLGGSKVKIGKKGKLRKKERLYVKLFFFYLKTNYY